MRFSLATALALAALPPCVAAEPFRLASKEDHEYYLKFLPKTDDEALKSVLAKPLVLYTDKEMPRAYQHDGGAHSPLYNISAVQPAEPFGNANVEFPWGNPAGTHRSKNASSIRFVHLPGPIRYWGETRSRSVGPEPVHVWEYPDKTVFGEILIVTDKDNYGWTFELRTRTKSGGKWLINLYRPYATRAEFAAKLKEVANIDLGPPKVSSMRLRNGHPTNVIDRSALVDELPPLSKDVVKKLLDQPFRSALGEAWVEVEGTEGYAPTTQADFHIVPKQYDGAFLKIDSKSCMTCHDGVLKHADHFQPRRDWYGNVRGSDGIFSFHIFEPSSISYNGFTYRPNLRQSLVRAGLLKHWNEK